MNSDVLSSTLDITKARSSLIREQSRVDDNTSLFISTFSGLPVSKQMSAALTYILTIQDAIGLGDAPKVFDAVNGVKLASETWAGAMAAGTTLTGIGLGLSVLDLVTTLYLGNGKKREAITIRDYVNNSLSS